MPLRFSLIEFKMIRVFVPSSFILHKLKRLMTASWVSYKYSHSKDGSNDQIVPRFVEVIHHLDKEDEPNFPSATQTLKDTKRALKPDGVIIASVSQPYLMSNSIWFSQLDDELTEKFNKRVPSLDQYQRMFDDAEVKCVSKLNMLGSSILKDYYRLDGPLDPSWRSTSSYWKFATEEDLKRIEKKITELKETGQLQKWVMEHDHTESKGTLTILTCKLL